MAFQSGSLVTLNYQGREFEVVVIDPNGLGKNQPSIGFGLTMMERHGGLPQATSSQWFKSYPNNESKYLQVPSGKTFGVIQIKGLDNNEYLVLEVSEWVALVADVLKKPGKVRKSTLNSLIDFLSWFAVQGFYSNAYNFLKGDFSPADVRAVSAWMQSRLAGIATRNKYTKFLNQQGCQEHYDYARWTDYVYRGLFGKTAREMREEWELVEGSKTIGRNYIPEVIGLKAVDYCEKQVIELHYQDLLQAHDDAISYTKKKFNFNF